MDPTEADLLKLIGLVYDAIQNPESWSEFLEHYACVLGAYITFIQRHQFRERTSQLVSAFGMTSPFQASYHAHYAQLNIWRNNGQHLYVPGRILRDPEILSRDTLVKSEFYNDFLFPIGGVHSIAGIVAREGDEAVTLTALNHHSRRAWEEYDKRVIEPLLPHVARAYAIQRRLRLLEAEESFLDTLDVGVVFLSADAHMLRANRAAEILLREADGLRVRNGTLRAGDSILDARLQKAIRHDASGRASLDGPCAIVVPRTSGKRAFQVLTAPLRHRVSTFAGERAPHVIALVIDPENERALLPAIVAALYGLTTREAELASALTSGMTLEKAADQLGVTYETARSHLRRIFDKTETTRQSELIVLLARLPKQTAP